MRAASLGAPARSCQPPCYPVRGLPKKDGQSIAAITLAHFERRCPTCKGFPSKPRAASEGGLLGAADASEADRAAELRAGVLNLSLAWGLVALCCTHHAGHALHAAGFHQVCWRSHPDARLCSRKSPCHACKTSPQRRVTAHTTALRPWP